MNGWPRPLTALLLLPAFGMAAVALRIAERAEPFNDRTLWLVGLAGLGGLGGSLALWLGQPFLPRYRASLWRLVAAGLLFTAGFLLAMMQGNSFYSLVISGHFEAHRQGYALAFLKAWANTGLLFLISCPPYLLPWPLPLLAGTAVYALLPPPAPKAVEPAAPPV